MVKTKRSTRKGKTSKPRSTPQLETPVIEASRSQDHGIITEDGILCSIISRLKLGEAVRTSILSRDWKFLWTDRTILKFDRDNLLDAHTLADLHENSPLTMNEKHDLMTSKMDQLLQSIYSIIQHHQGSRLDEFKIHFFLHSAHSHHLDAWVRFAVASKTKKLSLFLGQPFSRLLVEQYEFPCRILGSSSSVEELCLTHCTLKPPLEFDAFKHVAKLYLDAVDMSSQDFGRLLSNCPTLERLGLFRFQHHETLRFPHCLTHLRNLTIARCTQLKCIEIDAANLRHVSYRGVPVDFIIRRPSLLEEAKIHFENQRSRQNLDFYLTRLPRDLPLLRALTFHINGVSKACLVNLGDLLRGSNVFNYLKFLDLTWNFGVKMSLDNLSKLLLAFPFVENLKLHLLTRVVEPPPRSLAKFRKMLPKHPHSHLKTIEISDFHCDRWQIEIALYLLSNAIELESMTIEKSRESVEEISGEISEKEILEGVTRNEIHEKVMKNLSQEVPTNTKLVIL